MYASYAALILLGCALGWTALDKSGVSALDTYISLILIGLASLTFWLRSRRVLAPSFPAWLTATIAFLAAFAAFQAIPLPLGVLAFFSPHKAEAIRALDPVLGPIPSAPIALDQAGHILWFLTLAGYAAAFFLVRDLTFRLQKRLFLALLPLFLVAAFEGLLGLVQIAGGAPQAMGTYNSRDHYCCLLEMTMPISIAFGLAFWARRHASNSYWPILSATGCWLISAILVLGILFSLSRAGWVDSLIALIVLSSLLLLPRVSSQRHRLGILAGILLLATAVLVFASPGAMLNRLVGSLTPDSEGRLTIWTQLAPLLVQYRWFGTGLLGFDPIYLQFQNIANDKRVNFAHNDFLQYLIELGLFGFVPLIISLSAIVKPIVKNCWPKPLRSESAEIPILSVGCLAGLVTLFVHSLVDFNLYIPANVFAFSWILGFGSAASTFNPCRSKSTVS